MFSRYRSYTCYSEENGKLVPSIEPKVINTVQEIKENHIQDTNVKDKEIKNKNVNEVTKDND
jgi:hypothetical protein